jgi:hypothetical protein
MKGYIVVTHIEADGARKPLRAFAVLGEDHHEAVLRVRQMDAEGLIDVEAVLHLSEATATRLQLVPDEVWQL